MKIDVTDVIKGDVIRFGSYALRVECYPGREGNFVVLRGRININGCPIVTKKFMIPMTVSVDHREASVLQSV